MPLISQRESNEHAAAGILAGAAVAGPALLRMLSRARRRALPLVLVRLAWPLPAPRGALGRFCRGLAAELRISDLAWWARPGAELMLLLEAAESVETVVERLTRRAAAAGLPLRLRSARFPQQGLTLAALLAGVSDVEASDAEASARSGA